MVTVGVTVLLVVAAQCQWPGRRPRWCASLRLAEPEVLRLLVIEVAEADSDDSEARREQQRRVQLEALLLLRSTAGRHHRDSREM